MAKRKYSWTKQDEDLVTKFRRALKGRNQVVRRGQGGRPRFNYPLSEQITDAEDARKWSDYSSAANKEWNMRDVMQGIDTDPMQGAAVQIDHEKINTSVAQLRTEKEALNKQLLKTPDNNTNSGSVLNSNNPENNVENLSGVNIQTPRKGFAGVKLSPVEKFAWEKQAAGKGSVARNKAMLKQWQGVEPTKAATQTVQSGIDTAGNLSAAAKAAKLGNVSDLSSWWQSTVANNPGMKSLMARNPQAAYDLMKDAQSGAFKTAGKAKGGIGTAGAVSLIASALSAATDKSREGWTPSNQIVSWDQHLGVV